MLPTMDLSSHSQNFKVTMQLIYESVHMAKNPDGACIVARDFKRVDLSSVLPIFQQHINIPHKGDEYLGPYLH